MARRKVIVGAVAGAAMLAPTLALAQYGARRRARARLVVPAGERFELLGEPVRAGAKVGRHGLGIVEAVLPISAGAVPVVMRTPEGVRFQVDVLRRDAKGPAGVADTAHYSLFIANKGDGATPTDEAQAHAARGLAMWLAEREGAEVSALAGAELMSFRERQRAHPEGVFSLWQ